MRSNFFGLKKFFILFAVVSSVLTLALTGPFGSVLASSPYAPVFAQAFGSLGAGDGQFDNPGGIEVSANGLIYVSDTYNDRIEIFNATGGYQSKIDTFGSGDTFWSPRGIALDSNGNLYIVDSLDSRIVKLNASGALVKTWGSSGTGDGQFKEPYDIAVDTTNQVLYVADSRNHRVQKFTLDGAFLGKWGGTAAGSADDAFNWPSGIAVDSAGNVYVADTNNNRIKKISPNGVFLEKFGAMGSGDGQFSQPRGIAIDAEDTLYVLDTGNNRVQKLMTSGGMAFVAKWGSSGAGNGQFSVAYAIAARSADAVFVADTSNNRVQHFEPDQPPYTMNIDGTSVLENKPAGTRVGVFTTGDDNALDTFTYSFTTDCGGADNSSFQISGAELQTNKVLSLQEKPNYYICVRVTDSGGMSFMRPFVITVENVNDAPVIADQTLPPLSEAAPNGTVVGTLTATDPDSNDRTRFSKTGGTGANMLDVLEDGQVVVTNSSLLDFETQPILTLRARATDIAGAFTEATITIYLADANDAPVPTPISIEIDEYTYKTTPKGTLVGPPLTYTDQDRPAQDISWKIISTQPSYANKSIRFLTGFNDNMETTVQSPQLVVVNPGPLDFEGAPVITLTIRLTDNGFPSRYTDYNVTVTLKNVNEPPNCNPTYNVWIAENSTVGQATGTFTIYDPEKKITQWNIIGGDPMGANFTLVSQGLDKNNNSLAELVMTTQVDLNYESEKRIYPITIDVTDDAGYHCHGDFGGQDPVTLNLNVYGVNEPPYFPADAIRPPDPAVGPNVNEFANGGPAVDTLVTEVYAADPDGYGTTSPNLWYDIIAGNPGPNNNKAFKIGSVDYQTDTFKNRKGVITVNNPSQLDFEMAPVINLTVQVHDGNWKTATIIVPVKVNNKNEPPKINPQTFYASEGAAVGTTVGQVVATDPEPGDTHKFYLVPSGTGTDPFSITESGEIRVADTSKMIDGTTYTLTVRATDSGVDPSGVDPVQPLSGEGTVKVYVSNGNNPPSMEDQTFTVDENTGNGTSVYKIVASDHDNNKITFSLKDSTQQSAFAIDPTTGAITVADSSVLNYESAAFPSHAITFTVHAQDDGTPSKSKDANITAYINDVNEAPQVENTSFNIDENSKAGTTVGKVFASDQDLGTSLTFTITGGNDGDAFDLDQLGNITVKTAGVLDADTLPGPFHLMINVTDDGSPALTTPVTVTVVVNNVNEPAVLLQPASFSIDENSLAGTEIGIIQAADQDIPANNLVFNITSGNSEGIFALDNAGHLTVNQSYCLSSYCLNYEAKSSYTLLFTISDDSAKPAVAGPFEITVTVNNVDEAPELENTYFEKWIDDRTPADGIVLVQVPAVDPEGTAPVFEIMGGNMDKAFKIDPSESNPNIGEIRVNNAAAIDYGKNPLFQLTVSASDGYNTSTAQVNIFVTPHPDLALTVQAPNTVLAGTSLKFDIQVKNTGYITSDPYTLTIHTPPQLTFDPMGSWLDCDATDANTVTCGNSSNGIAGLGYLNLPVYYQVTSDLPDNTPIAVNATINVGGDDLVASNNTWQNTITGWANVIPLYSQNFNASPNLAPFWKVGSAAPTVTTAPLGEKFLGPLVNDSLVYQSELLPSHQSVTVSYDLYVIGDWSGSDLTDGPDQWRVIAGSDTLLNTSFSNRTGIFQSFPGTYPSGSNAAFTGSTAKNTLGYTGTTDATYHMKYTISHTDSTLSLNFLANLPKPGNKRWGIDNVTITVNSRSSAWTVFLPITRK